MVVAPDKLREKFTILNTIGNTPIVELQSFTLSSEAKIFLKLEMFSPGLSKKDRVALQMINDAKNKEQLLPGQPVIELTSGNMGIGLAIVCAAMGHPFHAVMSTGNSVERRKMLNAFGARVHLVEQVDGSPGHVTTKDLGAVEYTTRQLCKKYKAFRPDQFLVDSNYIAHQTGTGREILVQLENQVDAFCDFVGSGGSFAGCAKAFDNAKANIECFIVEPTGVAVLAGHPISDYRHRIQGGGYAKPILQQIENIKIDGFIQVSDEEARLATRKLARQEGIFAGYSTGANVAAAVKLIQSGTATRVVTLANDSGMKYLSTDLWSEPNEAIA